MLVDFGSVSTLFSISKLIITLYEKLFCSVASCGWYVNNIIIAEIRVGKKTLNLKVKQLIRIRRHL
jgi:hypothetical protein